jgi:dolichyl-phosphate-mannose--protein O-mannosyl transferase
MQSPAPPRIRAALAGLVMALAAWLYLPGLGQPRLPVWDETYYIASTARYQLGQAQLASHPPLGMMLIAAGERASGLNAGTDWQALAANRGVAAEKVPAGFDYRGVRIAPALFGVLATGLFALLMLQLTGSGGAALLLSALFLADGAIAVQLRSAQLDAFQLAFLLAALNCFVLALLKPGWRWTALFGLFLIAAALVRANALAVGVLAPFLLWPALRGQDWRALAARIAGGLAGGLTALALTVAAYIAMTPNPAEPTTPFGREQARFVSAEQRLARENSGWSASAILALAVDYRSFMANDLAITPKSDANGTHPPGWIVGRGSTLYGFDRSGGTLKAIGLMPNMVAWLIALAAVAVSLLPSRWRGDPLRAALLLGWLANMAVFVWLDTQRVLYTYHYLVPLLFGHALAALELKRWGWRKAAALALTALAVLFGAATWPLVTGTPAPDWLCSLIGGACPTG